MIQYQKNFRRRQWRCY